ncbi:hypothetical protein [Butyrivibrio hungatei]|uniref:Uncharacterized protein n=1 Tax=Butyrivibrio hungatei TaxID=185008 RepID=A0A1D9P5T6_9FIRM|nr:hypothetical protein [Butyrivibrio hungatei]AOZ97899.1 hypothetical protein bhn_II100 [Butyrivibrio hungatei]
MNRLTDKELLLTSECILKAMESMEEAKRHIVGPELVKALDIKMAELKALN